MKKTGDDQVTVIVLNTQGRQIHTEIIPEKEIRYFLNPVNMQRIVGKMKEGIKVIVMYVDKIVTMEYVETFSPALKKKTFALNVIEQNKKIFQ